MKKKTFRDIFQSALRWIAFITFTATAVIFGIGIYMNGSGSYTAEQVATTITPGVITLFVSLVCGVISMTSSNGGGSGAKKITLTKEENRKLAEAANVRYYTEEYDDE